MRHEIRSALDPYSPDYREARFARLLDDLKRRVEESDTPLLPMVDSTVLGQTESSVGFVSNKSNTENLSVAAAVDVVGGLFHLSVVDEAKRRGGAGLDRGVSLTCHFDLMYDSEVLSVLEDALVYAFMGR